MLAPVLGVAGAEVAPFLAPGTVGGTLIGETAGGMAMGELLNKGTEMLTGRNWGDNVRNTLENTFGYNPESWSYGQGTYNFLTDMTNPGYYNSRLLKSGINAAADGISNVAKQMSSTNLNVPIYYRGKPTQSIIPGVQFAKNFYNDLKNPKIGLSGIWDLTKSGDYAWFPSRIRRAKDIKQVIREAQRQQLDRMSLSAEVKAGSSKDFDKLAQIAQAKSDIGKYKIHTPGNYLYYLFNRNTAGASTKGTAKSFWFPMTKNPGTNQLRTAQDWLTNSALRRTLFHEPVHAAQYDLFPVLFGPRNGTVFTDIAGEAYNPYFIGYRSAEELASHPFYRPKTAQRPEITFNGTNKGGTLYTDYKEIPWQRQWVEFNADANGYAAARGYPNWNLMNSHQKMDLLDYLYGRFGTLNGTIKPDITRLELYKLAKQDGLKGLMAGGGKLKSE